MRPRKAVVTVLYDMQVFDQEVASSRPFAQQGTYLFQRFGVYLSAFRMGRGAVPTRPRVPVFPNLFRHFTCLIRFLMLMQV